MGLQRSILEKMECENVLLDLFSSHGGHRSDNKHSFSGDERNRSSSDDSNNNNHHPDEEEAGDKHWVENPEMVL